jgi:hypothetical protein
MFALRRTAKVVRSRALAIVSTLFALRTSARSSLSCSGSKALVASRSFPLRLHFDLATTIFNRAARLRTAAVLRFCVAIAATLIPDSASARRRLSSSDVQGMLPTPLISSPSPKARPLHLEA